MKLVLLKGPYEDTGHYLVEWDEKEGRPTGNALTSYLGRTGFENVLFAMPRGKGLVAFNLKMPGTKLSIARKMSKGDQILGVCDSGVTGPTFPLQIGKICIPKEKLTPYQIDF